MNLESYLNEVFEILLSTNNTSITAEQLIHCIDLTLLDEQAPEPLLVQLNKDALEHQVAAVCVYSKHLSVFQHFNSIQLATVINFPQGDEKLITSLKSIETASKLGATEMDYVVPYRMYLDGNKKEVVRYCQAIAAFCKEHKLTLKIILETGAFSKMHSIYEISTYCIESGCDFLKTSTGKIPQGASLPAVFGILSAIKDSKTNCGIKVSGGIKTPRQALNYATLAQLMMGKTPDKSCFRIGASSLLGELLQCQSKA